jgi:hypothetical protein
VEEGNGDLRRKAGGGNRKGKRDARLGTSFGSSAVCTIRYAPGSTGHEMVALALRPRAFQIHISQRGKGYARLVADIKRLLQEHYAADLDQDVGGRALLDDLDDHSEVRTDLGRVGRDGEGRGLACTHTSAVTLSSLYPTTQRRRRRTLTTTGPLSAIRHGSFL